MNDDSSDDTARVSIVQEQLFRVQCFCRLHAKVRHGLSEQKAKQLAARWEADHAVAAARRQALKERRRAGTVQRQACKATAHRVIEPPRDMPDTPLRELFDRFPYWRMHCGCGYSTKAYPLTMPDPLHDMAQHLDARGSSARAELTTLHHVTAPLWLGHADAQGGSARRYNRLFRKVGR